MAVQIEPLMLMSDDNYDDLNGSYDPFCYEDPISERAMVFHHLAKLADELKDQQVKELCLTILKKLNSSIRVPTGELKSIKKSNESQ